MTMEATMKRKTEFRLTGRHVLIAFLTFFGAIITWNGVFIYLALTSFTGLTTENAYLKGLAYNQTIDDAARQRALGWRAGSSVARIDGLVRVTFRLDDKDGAPIPGLQITATLRDPVQAKGDLPLSFAAQGDAWIAEATPPRAGNWQLSLVARDASGNAFTYEKHLVLK